MSQSYRLRIQRASLKLKVNTRIPAQLDGGTGIAITRTNGVYTFDFDLSNIGTVTTIDQVYEAVTFFPIWNSTTDGYALISATNYKVEIGFPASSTDNAIARFDGVTGSIQDSDAIIDDSENLSGIGNITGKAGGITVTGGTGSGDDLRLTSTSNATKGTINLGNATTGLFFDETNERISLGADDQTITVNGSSLGIDLAIHNNEAGEVCQTTFRYASGATRSACWWGARARGSIGSENIVQANDRLALIQALGFDGTDFEAGAQIFAEVDGTPGNNDMPTRWVFTVTPDGSATPVEAFRIQQNRDVLFASGSILTLQNTGLHLLDTDASHDLIVKPGSDLAADRTLTVTTGDADRTLDISAASVTVSSFGATLVDDADQTAARVTLGLTPGTDVQAYDADLAALAANSTDGLWSHTGAGTGAARTLTAPAAGITITNPAGIAGDPTLVLANDLAALEGLASTGIARRTGPDAWSVGTAVANSELATMAAYTIKGNATGSSAVPTDISIPALTQKASPVAGDYVMIADSADSNSLKYSLVSALASAGSVATYNGRTGTVTATGTDVPLRSYLAGLTLSTAGSSATFGIAAGVATDSTNVSMMALASAYTKTTSSWAVGTGNGALDTGSVANSTWYHVLLIQRPDTGVVDVLLSLSSTSPTLPANYTLFRRIGSMKTDGSAQWTLFLQTGDRFQWDAPSVDVNVSNPGTSAVLRTLSVPPGFKVEAFYDAAINNHAATANGITYFSDPDTTDIAAASPYALGMPNQNDTNVIMRVSTITNTSSQIRTRALGSSASTGLAIATRGWIDTRGRLD